jgi:hypothetical protein
VVGVGPTGKIMALRRQENFFISSNALSTPLYEVVSSESCTPYCLRSQQSSCALPGAQTTDCTLVDVWAPPGVCCLLAVEQGSDGDIGTSQRHRHKYCRHMPRDGKPCRPSQYHCGPGAPRVGRILTVVTSRSRVPWTCPVCIRLQTLAQSRPCSRYFRRWDIATR